MTDTTDTPTAPAAAPAKRPAKRPATVASVSTLDKPAPAGKRNRCTDVVRFATTDPLTGEPITGVGVVLEDHAGQVLVAPLHPLQLRIPHDQLSEV